MNVGDRVGAIASTSQDTKTAQFFGYGVYQGKEVPPKVEGDFMSDMMNSIGMTNPKILLDSGEVVWGFQCWWAPEEKVKEMLDGLTINMITVSEYNALAANEGE